MLIEFFQNGYENFHPPMRLSKGFNFKGESCLIFESSRFVKRFEESSRRLAVQTSGEIAPRFGSDALAPIAVCFPAAT
jgi:hypothetical protein